jgi:hypothetical protein
MRWLFGIWTIAVALTVSVVAAYYSIVGLTALFAAAVIPVIIMGAALELGKVTAAVYLHSFWHEAAILTKVYLTCAIVVLMFITSMGIFGFLSKAHIEQGASGGELTARIERMESDLLRQEQIIERANLAITNVGAQVTSADVGIQDRIEDQERLIASTEARLARDIALQTDIIEQEQPSTGPLQQELTLIEQRRTQLQQAQQNGDVRSLQALVGANVDGVLGPSTRAQITQFETDLNNRRSDLIDRLTQAQTAENPAIDQARLEISRLQAEANAEIQRTQDAINTFRNQLIDVTTQDNSGAIAEQELVIQNANTQIDQILNEKFDLEAKVRAIEIEVGPVKYIAELIYGETSPDLLEEAVRWVILILVLVFDPLAVVLILAGISIMHTTPTSPPRKEPPAPPAPVIDPIAPVVEDKKTTLATDWVPGFIGNDVPEPTQPINSVIVNTHKKKET